MIGIIDIGGGLRGVFGAGVFDRLLDENINFEYIIGVSAGAANVCSYLGKQKGRNLKFYTEYSLRPEYMSFSNVLHGKQYLDLSYVYKILSNEDGENPLDYDTLSKYTGSFLTVATNAITGNAHYFDISYYKRNDYKVLMASSCLPAICKPIIIDDIPYYDGGVADPIPIRKAFYDGCEKVIVIITRPVNEEHSPSLDKKAAFILKKQYPNTSNALFCRYQKYNACLNIAKEYQNQGKALIIAPDNCDGLSTLTKDMNKLHNLYKQGYEKANDIISFITK